MENSKDISNYDLKELIEYFEELAEHHIDKREEMNYVLKELYQRCNNVIDEELKENMFFLKSRNCMKAYMWALRYNPGIVDLNELYARIKSLAEKIVDGKNQHLVEGITGLYGLLGAYFNYTKGIDEHLKFDKELRSGLMRKIIDEVEKESYIHFVKYVKYTYYLLVESMVLDYFANRKEEEFKKRINEVIKEANNACLPIAKAFIDYYLVKGIFYFIKYAKAAGISLDYDYYTKILENIFNRNKLSRLSLLKTNLASMYSRSNAFAPLIGLYLLLTLREIGETKLFNKLYEKAIKQVALGRIMDALTLKDSVDLDATAGELGLAIWYLNYYMGYMLTHILYREDKEKFFKKTFKLELRTSQSLADWVYKKSLKEMESGKLDLYELADRAMYNAMALFVKDTPLDNIINVFETYTGKITWDHAAAWISSYWEGFFRGVALGSIITGKRLDIVKLVDMYVKKYDELAIKLSRYLRDKYLDNAIDAIVKTIVYHYLKGELNVQDAKDLISRLDELAEHIVDPFGYYQTKVLLKNASKIVGT